MGIQKSNNREIPFAKSEKVRTFVTDLENNLKKQINKWKTS